MSWRVFKKDPKRTKWTIEGRDHTGAKHRVSAFRDKTLSEELARNVARIVEHRAQMAPLPPLLAAWVQQLAPRLKAKLASFGLLDAHTRPLCEHLDDYEASLTAKGNGARHVRQTIERIRRVVDGCQFTYWSDVQGNKVQRFITALKSGRSDQATPETRNHYLGAMKSFCRWAVREGRLAQSPIEHLSKIEAGKVRTQRKHERRALSVEEVRRLLSSTRGAPERFGMTGPERAMLYRLAIETGLRVSELRSLTRSSFDFSGDEPTATAAGAYKKNKEPAVIPLRVETARTLREFLAVKVPNAPAFNVPDSTKTAAMLREDLQAAEIPYRVDGKVADFHALRHTCGTWLAAAGTHPKVIQRVMRHSTITLTMDRYTHLFKGDEAAAIATLPDLSSPDANSVSATGTDDIEYVVDVRGALRGAQGGSNPPTTWTGMDSKGTETEDVDEAQVIAEQVDSSASATLTTADNNLGPVAESADAADLKSAGPQGPSGFESRRGHWHLEAYCG